MPHLQYSADDQAPQRFVLRHRLTSIGSSPDCHLALEDPAFDVAPSHCTILHEPGRYRIEAAQRSTPFFVQGKKCRAHDLRHGDVFRVGNVEFVFAAIDATPAAPEPASDQDPNAALAAMRRLQTFSDLLAAPNSLQSLLDELIDQVVALTGANKGFLVLAVPDGEGDTSYEVRVGRNLERQPVDDPQELLSDEIIRACIEHRTPQIISDACADARFQNSLSVVNLQLSSVMCVPLLVRGELLGLIYVGNNDIRNLFQPEQLELLNVFAGQAALFIKNASLLNELRTHSAELETQLDRVKFGSIIGACPQMVEVYKRVDKVASTDITVLITGETGTGKELIARELHNRSDRAKGPFITVNCGAIPENLIESELFGHVKGAFTGAISNQVGKFQAAQNGTLFLDEIGELPQHLQVKLLRALQDRKVQRVGDATTMDVDIRVVAATNRDLSAEVRENRFREDLYFRLNVIGVELPPLRERGDDVLLIARYLVKRYADEFSVAIDANDAFDAGGAAAMRSFEWPGNIRQLENHLKKALVLKEGPRISAADLDLQLPEGTQDDDGRPLPLNEAREHWQREYINKVLAMNDGNRTKTARDLGVDPRTIFRHLEKLEKADG